MSKISVLCPTFNHEKFVGYFIQSVLNQSYTDWELIIVDDCSTDNNVLEIKKYTDKRIKLFISDFNQGIGNSLNRAFEESSGEYLVICASDDMLKPDYFEYINKSFNENHKAGVIYSSLDVIDESNSKYNSLILDRKETRYSLLKKLFYEDNVLFSPGLAVRRDVFSRIMPMDISMIQHQDYQWHVQFLGITDCIIADKAYVNYRVVRKGKNSLSNFNRGEFNRKRLEIDRLMDAFLYISDLSIIKVITGSDFCDVLNSKCYGFIWGIEALKSKNFEKKQWGYKIICKCFNDKEIRTELNNKIGLTFGKFIQYSKDGVYFRDKEFEKKQFRLKLINIYHILLNRII